MAGNPKKCIIYKWIGMQNHLEIRSATKGRVCALSSCWTLTHLYHVHNSFFLYLWFLFRNILFRSLNNTTNIIYSCLHPIAHTMLKCLQHNLWRSIYIYTSLCYIRRLNVFHWTNSLLIIPIEVELKRASTINLFFFFWTALVRHDWTEVGMNRRKTIVLWKVLKIRLALI